jgi:lactoylglutathione lyase
MPTTKTKATKTKAKKPGAPKAKAASKPSGKLSLDKLGYAIMFVSDMNRGVKFYSETLGIPLRFSSPEWTELEMQGCTLALHHADKMPKNLDQAAITELCFETADVRGARAKLLAAGVKVSELRSVCEIGNQVGASGSFRDADGNHLSIFGMVPRKEWSGPSDR